MIFNFGYMPLGISYILDAWVEDVLLQKGATFISASWDNLKISLKGFPGGSVVKNLPVNAGDMSLIPDPGRSHMPHSN